jgi:hypothetical protein
VANEDQLEFEVMEVKLRADVHPRGALEQTLFSELLTASWQLRRICRPQENQGRPDLATPVKPAPKISERTQPASELDFTSQGGVSRTMA